MRVLITGANGFLGWYLCQQLMEKNYEVIATGKGEGRLPFLEGKDFTYLPMDFTDPFAVHDVFEKSCPHIVIHAGAMSKPDECELSQWEAFRTNVEGTVTLLNNAEEQQSFFVFLSTDFIFDGKQGMYREEDMPNPVNYYGKTKWEAEQAVQEYPHEWAIVRTVLVYGKSHGGRGNLLTVVKEKLEKKESYQVFNDQQRTPTYVEDLAAGIVAIIEKKARGVYHISGEERLTPYEMACQTADRLGLDRSLLGKITAADFRQPATRPLKTGFTIEKAKRDLDFRPCSFKEGLAKTFS
jgi:dTDP-4-dehydrorhamnose reductase